MQYGIRPRPERLTPPVVLGPPIIEDGKEPEETIILEPPSQ